MNKQMDFQSLVATAMTSPGLSHMRPVVESSSVAAPTNTVSCLASVAAAPRRCDRRPCNASPMVRGIGNAPGALTLNDGSAWTAY